MNKPVAYMLVDEINGDYMLERHPSGDYDWIPLYTHPAELTDEEILQVMINVYSDTVPPIRGVEFARAILRKAQEK